MWENVPENDVRNSISHPGKKRKIVEAIAAIWDEGIPEFTNKEIAESLGFTPQGVGQFISMNLQQYIGLEKRSSMRAWGESYSEPLKSGWRFTRDNRK